VEVAPREVVAIGAAVVPVAARGLTDSDAEVRSLSLEAIQQCASALGDLLPSPEGRAAMGRDVTGGRPARGVGDEEFVTDVTALAHALDQLGPALGQALADPDPRVRILTCRALEDMAVARDRMARRAGEGGTLPTPPAPKPPAGTPMRGAALTDETPSVLVAQAAPTDARSDRPLTKGQPEILRALARRLRDPDWRVRLGALDVLEILGPEAKPGARAVARATTDRNLFVRWAAARTLGKMGPVDVDEVVPALARLLNDPDLDVRMVSAGVLHRYGPDAGAAVPALARRVGAGDVEVRVAALQALDAIGKAAEPAVPAVSAQLDHPDVRVRRAAAEVLGGLGPLARGAEPALRRALTDPDHDVRQAVSDALLNILPVEDTSGK
jgi:HEAT repeat protein